MRLTFILYFFFSTNIGEIAGEYGGDYGGEYSGDYSGDYGGDCGGEYGVDYGGGLIATNNGLWWRYDKDTIAIN